MSSDNFLNDFHLKREILRHIENGQYRLTRHAAAEQANDEIDLRDTLRVLKTGIHEKDKTLLSQNVWKYAIKGKTEDLKIVRVIVCFLSELVIITVIKLKTRS